MEPSTPVAAPATKRNRLGPEVALIVLGLALNVGIGALAHALKLPVYLDTIGTIAVTLIVGLRAGIITGVLSSLLNGVVTDPLLPAFAATQVAVALYVHFGARRGWFGGLLKTILAGLGLGVVSAIVSAPVAAYLFGGITGYGASEMSEFLLQTGQNVFDSVVLSGLASDPVDKLLESLVAFGLLRALPQRLLRGFRGGSLRENRFVRD